MSRHPRPAHPSLALTAWQSLPQALVKLNPRHLFGSPVIFVVWVGSVLTTVLSAVLGQDYPLVSAITLIITLMVLVANFAIEIVYGFLDPRIKAAQIE